MLKCTVVILSAWIELWVLGGHLAYAAQVERQEAPSGTRGVDVHTPDSTRRLTVVRTTSAIDVDGRLDERDWALAPAASGFIQNEPREGDPASEDTEVRALYDQDNLYVGVFAHDPEPDRIIVTDLREDFSGNDADLFELVLDTFLDERNGYMFSVNPAGAKSDAQMANEGREINRSWDGVWVARTRVTEAGWYAEIAIPFRTLKVSNADQQTWGINFMRRVRRHNEDSFWAPLPRIYSLSRVSMAGRLEGLQNVRGGKNLRVKPYALASVGKIAGTRRDGDGDVGFDVKYGITSGLTQDFTVNTDFAQVEADEQQVNLSRFSLFFPEKRDFFLENSGVFQFGVAQTGGGGGGGGGRQDDAARNDVILFHSRRIGLSNDADAIPILAGTRLSGRVGPYSIGALNIQQRGREAVSGTSRGTLPATNFTAFRLRRDVLASSDLGVMVLNKDENGPRFNRVVGVDGNFRFFDNLNVSASGTKTFSPSSLSLRGGDDAMWRTNLSYRGDIWEFRSSYTTIGEEFNDEMGYVPRVGITKKTAFVSPHIRIPAWTSRLRETWPHWDFSQVTRVDGGLDSRYYDYHWPFVFQNGAFAEVGFQRTIEGPATPFRINARRNVVIPAGEYAFNDWFITARSNPARPFSGNFRYGMGDFYDGYRHIYQAGISARVNEQFNVTASLSRNVITLPAGAFTTNLISSRIVYSFSTNMFLNALLQYNTDAQQWASNVRFNIIHRPLSDIFIVYNEQRDSRTDDLISRALIAKMTYMMEF